MDHPLDDSRDKVFLGNLGNGWSEFRALEWLWKAVGFVCVSNLMGAPYFVLGPLIAKQSLGGASAWGVMHQWDDV